MAITAAVVPLEDNRARLDVAVAQEEVDRRFEQAARRLGRDLKIPGFRPGKAPSSVVVQRLGRDAVLDRMMQDSLDDWYAEAVLQSGLRPVEVIEVDPAEAEEGAGISFAATLQLRPKAELGPYKGLEVGKPEPEVPEGALDAELERLRRMVATLAPVERPAEEGDVLVVDFDGAIAGEPLPSAQARDYMVELGGGRLVPAFDRELHGLGAGETRTFSVAYPEEDTRRELAGRTVDYTVTAKSVQAPVLPELDDELAKQVSEFETFDELRAEIAARLQAQADAEVGELFRRRVIDAAVAGATVEIPDVMVDQRVNQILHDFSHRLPQGVSLGDYLRSSGQTLEAVQQDLRPDAEMAVRRELVVEAVAEAESLEATDEEVEERVRTDAEAAGRDPEPLLQDLRRNGSFETLREDMVIEKAMRLLVDSATPIPMSLAEARESLWTPTSDVAPAAGGGRLWTPGDPEPGRRA